MKDKNSAQKVITSYRKRQQRGPYFIGGLAIVLVVIGILVLVIWLTGPNRPGLTLLSTATTTLFSGWWRWGGFWKLRRIY